MKVSTLLELESHLSEGWDGVEFGAEFCVSRLPALDEAKLARSLCETVNVEFSPVLPLVTEGEFQRAADWLTGLWHENIRWVSGDLGLLSWAKENLPGGRSVAGRALSRQQRGPRMMGILERLVPEQRKLVSASLWDDPLIVADFEALGVDGFQLDAVPWDFERPESLSGSALSLCGPWLAVTWSPWCFFKEGRGEGCGRECLSTGPLLMENDENPEPLFNCGKGIFLKVELDSALEAAQRLNAQALVWSPTPPA